MTLNLKIFYWLYNLSHHSAVFDRVVIFIAEKFDKILFVIALIFFITLFVLHRDWKNKGWVAWIYEAVIIGVSVVSAWVLLASRLYPSPTYLGQTRPEIYSGEWPALLG
jgi:hypothetical protein